LENVLLSLYLNLKGFDLLRQDYKLPGVASGIVTQRYYDGKRQEVLLSVPKENSLALFVNGQELVTINCSPTMLNFLVLGYLFGEGIIDRIEDVLMLGVCEDEAIANVILKKKDFIAPEKKIITSGCGGGTTFTEDFSEEINSELFTEPENIFLLVRSMLKNTENYHESGGIHASALCDCGGIISMSEDIGRHNTIDKIVGECIYNKIPTEDKILITTGRISSEMLRKAVKLKIPIVASLTSPTEMAVRLARELNVTLIGYVRSNKMTLYSCPDRIKNKINIKVNDSCSDSQLTQVAGENYRCQE